MRPDTRTRCRRSASTAGVPGRLGGWDSPAADTGFYAHHPYDLWRGPNPSGDYYPTVYTGDGIVSSKRWEACREGAEDYEYLCMLRRLIHKAKEAGKHAKAADAEALLRRAPEMAELLRDVGRRIPLREDGVLLYENATDALNAYRKQIAEACLELK